jgi:hypothetical protein
MNGNFNVDHINISCDFNFQYLVTALPDRNLIDAGEDGFRYGYLPEVCSLSCKYSQSIVTRAILAAPVIFARRMGDLAIGQHEADYS